LSRKKRDYKQYIIDNLFYPKIKKINDGVVLLLKIVFYLITLFGALIGVGLFMIGFHNSDLGHNMRYIEQLTGTELADYYNVSGDAYTPLQLISLGNDQMIAGFLIGLYCLFAQGYYYCWFLVYMIRAEEQ